MNKQKFVRNERGFVLVVSLLILMTLVIIGVYATTNSNMELQIAGNEIRHKLSFYAAESARSYVEATPTLYNDSNLSTAFPLNFPDIGDPDQTVALGATQSFNGFVTFDSKGAPPRNSGYEVEKFASINYRMDCTGNGPTNANAVSKVAAGFYRIGFKTN